MRPVWYFTPCKCLKCYIETPADPHCFPIAVMPFGPGLKVVCKVTAS